MLLEDFIHAVESGEPVSFQKTMTIIAEHYHYEPAQFTNGQGKDTLINEAGSNEGSCKIFAFAQLNQLDKDQTLNLFGDFYRIDVLNDPDGSGHQNIRNFINYGWAGIDFEHPPLTPK